MDIESTVNILFVILLFLINLGILWIGNKSKKDKNNLDFVFITIVTNSTIGLAFLNIFLNKLESMILFVPLIFIGLFMPLYVGWWRGILFDNVSEKARGWVYLTNGIFVYALQIIIYLQIFNETVQINDLLFYTIILIWTILFIPFYFINLKIISFVYRYNDKKFLSFEIHFLNWLTYCAVASFMGFYIWQLIILKHAEFYIMGAFLFYLSPLIFFLFCELNARFPVKYPKKRERQNKILTFVLLIFLIGGTILSFIELILRGYFI